MTTKELDGKIRELLASYLNLEDGEMMMPLKQSEVSSLHHAIQDLVDEAVREATR